MRHIISLGAGVQSSTMALMAAAGEITPMPECAIFSDTKREQRRVYEWLDWLEKQLPFPVYRVTAGDLGALIGKKPNGKFDYMPLPAFVPGSDGREALLNRSCTRDFKLTPIRRKQRELLGIVRKRSPKVPVVTQWIGISHDETQRAKPAREPWVLHRWPLIELRMTRLHCLEWMEKKGFPAPPRSACTFCPYHDDDFWIELRDNDPAAFAEAVEMDERIRLMRSGQRSSPTAFLHRTLIPLREVKFVPAKGGPDLFDEKGFPVECEGMCGL